jgi:hypothetical protein
MQPKRGKRIQGLHGTIERDNHPHHLCHLPLLRNQYKYILSIINSQSKANVDFSVELSNLREEENSDPQESFHF